MTIWKPNDGIRVKVIGIVWSKGRFLAAEVETSDGGIKGVRPLGGSVEFGETREQALHREFLEELGCAITIRSGWHVFENIFEHEGATGHEIIFAAKIDLANAALYDREEILFQELNGTDERARWFSIDDLNTRGLDLYPVGLRDVIEQGRVPELL